MTSPGNAPAALRTRGEEPMGIVKQQLERFEVLIIRLEEQARAIRTIRMRYLGQEPEPDGPTDKMDLPPDLHSRIQQDVNGMEEQMNRIDVDLQKMDNAY